MRVGSSRLRRAESAEPEFLQTFSHCFEDQIDALLEARPPVLSFVFGIPSPEILRALRQRAIKTIGAATTVDEACALEEAGIDLIVASGNDPEATVLRFSSQPRNR